VVIGEDFDNRDGGKEGPERAEAPRGWLLAGVVPSGMPAPIRCASIKWGKRRLMQAIAKGCNFIPIIVRAITLTI
jgi:hypothetical protein